MKIIFLSSYDPQDNKSWSGTPKRMLDALKSMDAEIIIIGPYNSKIKKILKYMSFAVKKILKYNYAHSILASLEYKLFFQSVIKKHSDANFIFAPASSTEIALLNTSIPIIYSSDVTFALIDSYYDNFSNLLKISRKESNFIEKKALDVSKFIIYPSVWAKESAINDYLIDKDKIKVIPWGANFDYIENTCNEKKITKSGKIKILFVGVDWYRKGGDIVYKTCENIREKYNLDIELLICGCTPIGVDSNVNWIKCFGRLNKNLKEDLDMLIDLYSNAHLLFVPSRNECYGMVFCEASAYSLPIISHNTGGIGSVVSHNVNGYLLDVDSPLQEYEAKIMYLVNNPDIYRLFSINSRNIYEKKLNWRAWVKNLFSYINNY